MWDIGAHGIRVYAPLARLSPAGVWLGPTFLLGSMGAVSTVQLQVPWCTQAPL